MQVFSLNLFISFAIHAQWKSSTPSILQTADDSLLNANLFIHEIS